MKHEKCEQQNNFVLYHEATTESYRLKKTHELKISVKLRNCATYAEDFYSSEYNLLL
jgi:hypothetical protein